MRTRKRHFVSWIAVALAAVAVLAPAVAQAGRDYPDGRVLLTQSKVQGLRDYPDGRALGLSRSTDLVSSGSTGRVASGSISSATAPGNGFKWSDAAIGAASSLALVALVATGATLIIRRRRIPSAV